MDIGQIEEIRPTGEDQFLETDRAKPILIEEIINDEI